MIESPLFICFNCGSTYFTCTTDLFSCNSCGIKHWFHNKSYPCSYCFFPMYVSNNYVFCSNPECVGYELYFDYICFGNDALIHLKCVTDKNLLSQTSWIYYDCNKVCNFFQRVLDNILVKN